MSQDVTVKAMAKVRLRVRLTDNGEIDDVLDVLDVDDIEEFEVVS